MKRGFRAVFQRAAVLLVAVMFVPAILPAQETFTNPLMEGADPHVVYHDGYYYMLVTRGDRVGIKRSANLHKINEYNEIVGWKFYNTEVGGHIWAPEMYLLDGDWYIYTCGQNTGRTVNSEGVPYVQEDQQMFVLQSSTGDPLGPYEFRSWLLKGTGAIDETIFTHTDGKRYIIWSQFNAPGQPQSQCLWIAELEDPVTVGAERVQISCPELAWERNGWPVNEGAAVLQRDGKTYVVYSGSGYTTPEYSLGYMVNTDGDLLNPDSWTKVGPVFSQNPDGGIYSTGHNSFIGSPDGSEDWIVYHGRLVPDGGASRYVFIQKFFWQGDVPDLGEPIPRSEEILVPSRSRGQVNALIPYGETDVVVAGYASDGTTGFWTVDQEDAASFNAHSRFMMVPGMADGLALSLESMTHRGHYLVNKGGTLEMLPYDGEETFREAATFIEREPFIEAEGFFALEALASPGEYLLKDGDALIVAAITAESAEDMRASAAWQTVDGYAIFDCNGDYHGEAFIDSCGYCAGGNTGREPILDKYMCPVSGVEELQQVPQPELQLYPNPVTDYLHIDVPGWDVLWGAMDVRVSDISGRVYLDQRIEAGKIHVGSMEDGLYILQVIAGKTHYSGLFVKVT